jgi:hypothetical protein
MTKYISQENADLIKKLMELCNEEKENISFKIYDTESCVIYTRNIDKIIDEMDGGDEEFGINIVDRETKNYIGWFGVLPYEDFDDVIFDHTDNDLCNNVFNKLFN